MPPRTARLLAALTFVWWGVPAPLAAQPGPSDVSVFADVPSPGAPEGIAVAPDGSVVYVGTNRALTDQSPHPSVIFAYDADGVLIDQWDIEGQNPNSSGVLGLALDGHGALYVCDRDQARIVRLVPSTGAQTTYATFHDVAPCAGAWSFGDDCSAGDSDDSGPNPNYLVFAADGTLYVTDSSQGLIWRVPPGGGPGEVWFTDASFDAIFGPNGIQFRADGTTLLFAMTGYQGPDFGFTTGRLHEIDVQQPSGDPGTLTTLWTSMPVDGPDGLSITASGDVFVPLAGTNQLVRVLANGSEDYRLPANPAEAAMISPPFDMPASTGFLGNRLLMTNQSLFLGNPISYVVYEIDVDEPGLALSYPLIEPGGGDAGPKATGGGWLAPHQGKKINFGFNAKQKESGPQGNLQLNDKTAGVKIHLSDVTAIGAVGDGCGSVVAGPDALEFQGSGTFRGPGGDAEAEFLVCVEDNGEPGNSKNTSTPDLFYLACLSGCDYDTGSRTPDDAIDGGNIQVHGAPASGQGAEAAVLVLDPVNLSQAAVGVQELTVTAYGGDGEALPGAGVSLVRTDTSGVDASGITGSSGTATFQVDVLAGAAEWIARSGDLDSNAVEVTGLPAQ